MVDYTIDRKLAVRALFLLVVFVCLTAIGLDFVSASQTESTESAIRQQSELPPEERTPIVEPRDSATVIGLQGQVGAARFVGGLVAFRADGSLLYFSSKYDTYYDVDPVEGTKWTVLYVAANETDHPCRATNIGGKCHRNFIGTVNLTTGARNTLFSTVARPDGWHDVDRLNGTHYVVAGIGNDRVFVLDTETGIIEWEWKANHEFDPFDSGGEYPDDWTHVNDVEVLDDGTIMASLRNHDQVVFLNRSGGMIENRTLGSDDDHTTLYEQHNPDYIPERNGGPAVLVAGSENNRIVEYQRVGDSWKRTWTWSRPNLQWPRDADRLPNGHTLVVNSNNDEVIEVDRSGEVVWRASVPGPYDAERLGTGDESTGGPAAVSAGLSNRTASAGGIDDGSDEAESVLLSAILWVRGLIPGPILNGIVFLRPLWLSNLGLALIPVLLSSLGGWALVEFVWSSYTLQNPLTRE